MIYKIYNYLLKTNIALERFDSLTNCETFDIFINFNFTSDIEYKKHCDCEITEDSYVIYLYNIIYKINKVGNRIDIYCSDLEYFYSSCFNLPFSIVSYINKNLLLHSSSIEKDNKIIAFCAKKGQGKTTLVSYLSRYYKFYSDDTMILKLSNKSCIVSDSGA